MKQYVPFLADKQVEQDDSSALDEMRETLGEGENDPGTDENVEESSDENENMSDTDQGVEVEDLIEETVEETTQVENTTPPVTSGDGPYHIIAGAFSSQVNADRLAKKLQGEGLPASVIMNVGMHTVSMKSFASAADANASLTEMKSHSSGAWVLFKQ
jgi:cell division protein FtsN